MKRNLANKISSSEVDGVDEQARRKDSIAGKLIGVGEAVLCCLLNRKITKEFMIYSIHCYLFHLDLKLEESKSFFMNFKVRFDETCPANSKMFN